MPFSHLESYQISANFLLFVHLTNICCLQIKGEKKIIESTFISGPGDKSILEVAELLRADTKVYETMVEELKKTPEKMGFLARMIYLLDHAGDDILKVVAVFTHLSVFT